MELERVFFWNAPYMGYVIPTLLHNRFLLAQEVKDARWLWREFAGRFNLPDTVELTIVKLACFFCDCQSPVSK